MRNVVLELLATSGNSIYYSSSKIWTRTALTLWP